MAKKKPSDEEQPAPPPPPDKVTRHVQPVGPRVLVRILKNPDRLESGLFLPAGAKDEAAQALLAEVLEVARAQGQGAALYYDDDDDDDDVADFGENVSGIPIGCSVLFEKRRGVGVPWDETLRLLDVRHVLAIVEEIPQDEIQ